MPLDPAISAPATRLFTDDPELAKHIGTPWLDEFLAERYPQVSSGKVPAPGPVEVDDKHLSMHAFLVGGTGSGKTRLALHLLREQLKLGHSAVVIDFKRETVLQALACARDAGLGPDKVSLLWPEEQAGGMPEWNLLGGRPEAAVAGFVGVMRQVFGDSWGPRLHLLLSNACLVAAAQGLGIREAVEILFDQDYGPALMRQAKGNGAWDRFPDAHRTLDRAFFSHPASARREMAAPVLSKVYAFTHPFLAALCSARRDTLDLPGLFRRQRLVAVHLDRLKLGDGGAELLAPLLAHSLYAAAETMPGNVPVVLFLDELDRHEAALGKMVLETVRRSRSLGIRLVAATQTLSTVQADLQDALLGNAWLQCFFNVGDADAMRIASSVARGAGQRLLRAELRPRKERGETFQVERFYEVLDGQGNRVAIPSGMWHAAVTSADPSRAVPLALRAAGIRGATAAGIPFEEAAKAVSGGDFLGSFHMVLRVRFPRPELREAAYQSEGELASSVAGLLQSLPQRKCLVRAREGEARLLQAERTEFDRVPVPSEYMVSGQRRGAPAEERRRQEAEMERVRSTRPTESAPAPPLPPRRGRQRTEAPPPMPRSPLAPPVFPPAPGPPPRNPFRWEDELPPLPNPFREMEDDGSI